MPEVFACARNPADRINPANGAAYAPQQRSNAMATSLLHPLRSKRNGTFHDVEASIEEQIENLREEIASLTKLVSKSNAGQKIRYKAEAGLEDVVGRSEELLQDLQENYLKGMREVRETVRRHPAATIGAAAAFGIVLALLARR
jgi:ElaB/YqjD/DUF883 family membrane-anchored ribosome-binding protein